MKCWRNFLDAFCPRCQSVFSDKCKTSVLPKNLCINVIISWIVSNCVCSSRRPTVLLVTCSCTCHAALICSSSWSITEKPSDTSAGAELLPHNTSALSSTAPLAPSLPFKNPAPPDQSYHFAPLFLAEFLEPNTHPCTSLSIMLPIFKAHLKSCGDTFLSFLHCTFSVVWMVF